MENGTVEILTGPNVDRICFISKYFDIEIFRRRKLLTFMRFTFYNEYKCSVGLSKDVAGNKIN